MMDNGNGVHSAGDNGNGAHPDEPVEKGETPTSDPYLKEDATGPFDRYQFDQRLLDPSNTHTQDMVFPGYDGLPFRGTPPLLKEDDPEARKPQMGTQVFVNVLSLNDEKDLAYYQSICQAVGNGYAQISVEKMQWIDEEKNWKVLIRWMLSYQYMTDKPANNGA